MPTPTPTEGDDTLTNSQPNDTINALGGNDMINVELMPGIFATAAVDGGSGFDTLQTGSQNGLGFIMSLTPGAYQIRYSSSTYVDVTYAGVERLILTGRNGSAGQRTTGATEDWITFTGTGGASIHYDSGAGDDRVVVTGLQAGASVFALGVGNDSIDISGSSPTNLPSFTVTGGIGNDQMMGSSVSDYFYGEVGTDTLNGGGGNDYLDGGTGIDQMVGGLGNDRFFVEAGDVISELAGEGIDIAYARTDYTLTAGAHVDLLGVIDGASTAAMNLTGNELANTIQGNAGANRLLGLDGADYLVGLGGNDVLDGGLGIDTLDGGTGNDRYYVDQGDRVLERPGEGTDIVYAGTDYVLNAGAHVELLGAVSGTATDPIDLTGNELSNTIQGNAGANILTGAGGGDYLTGFGGADIFRYLAASDSARGAADRIADFVSGVDEIDLSAIDANSNTAANDAFTFIGTDAFTNLAGQLRVEVIGGQSHLAADLNGDGVADMHIVVTGSVAAGDFFL